MTTRWFNDKLVQPRFDRIVRVLTDKELEEELKAEKGEIGYQAALRVEIERRGQDE